MKRALQGAVIVAALAFAVVTISRQWDALSAARAQLTMSWGWILAASVLTLGTYAALVHAWRLLTAGDGALLRFGTATRIWAISNLGRYIPGKVWSIVALGVLGREAGASPVMAATAAVAGTVMNIGLGFAIVGLFGGRALEAMDLPGGRPVAILAAGGIIVGLLAAPWLLPWVVRWITSRSDSAVELRLPTARLATVSVINALSWCGYGVAFHWVAKGIGVPGGDPGTMIAVFSASYLAGYLALPLPGGLVVREAALVAALTGLGTMGRADATLLAVFSRLWLTVLEVLPGCVALAVRSRRTPDTPGPA